MRTLPVRTFLRAASAWAIIGLLAGLVVVAAIAFAAGRRTAPQQAETVHDHAAPEDEAEVDWWTCSMHPQIKQPEPGLCPICAMELIPMTKEEEDEEGTLRRFATSEAAMKLMEIQTAAVERKYVATEVRMVGTVTYDETRVGYITAWVPGRLDRLFVDFTGVRVRKGDHMVYMYSPEIMSAQQEFLQALASRERLRESELPSIRRFAKSTVDSARAKLRLLGLTPEQIEEIRERGTPSDHITVYAPMGGVVIHKNAQEGMYVQTGTRVYTIADLSQVWVQLDAYESDLPWLHYGQTVTFMSEAYPGETFEGKIAFIHPFLDAKTRTVKVRVNVPNEDGRLKPDMFVGGVVYANIASGGRVMDPELAGKWMCPMHPSVVKDAEGECDICEMDLVETESLGYVALAEKEEAKPLVIPATAPLVTGKRAVVYVRDPRADRPTFDGREVVLGPRAGDFYIVKHGLQEGERVVSRGAFKIDSALQIQAKPSMMTPDAALQRDVTALTDIDEEDREHAAGVLAVFWNQLRHTQREWRNVREAVEAENLHAAHEAFAAFGDAVGRVDAEQLFGRPRQVWIELAMQLKNDAFIGAEAADMATARDALDSLSRRMERIRDYFEPPEAREARLDREKARGIAVPEEFIEELTAVYQAYLDLHSALAQGDKAGADQAVAGLSDAVGAVDGARLEGEARERWKETLAGLDAALEELRAPRTRLQGFSNASDALTLAARFFGAGGAGPLHRAHCPMAFDNRGADWLQQGEVVSNPYFGGAMPTCGDIRETLESREPPPPPVAEEEADEGDEEPEDAPDRAAAPTGFQEQLTAVYRAYLDLHAALAENSEGRAAQAVARLAATVGETDMKLLEGEAHAEWMKRLEALNRGVDSMKAAEDNAGRAPGFAEVSDALAATARAFGTANAGPLHLIRCPMAFGNQGANWLQTDRETRNPYFGGGMLTCGVVEETINEQRGGRQHD